MKKKGYAVGTALGVTLFGIVTKCFDMLKVALGKDDFISYLFTICLCVTFFAGVDAIAKLEKKFNHDVFGLIDDQYKEQEEVLEAVIKIAGVVQKDTEKIGQQLEVLGSGSETIAKSIAEVASGNQATCEATERQNIMTQSIQSIILKNIDQIKEVVQVVEKVNGSIGQGQCSVNEVRMRAEESKKENEEVVTAMNELRKEAIQMEKATETIMQISAQINLLALNASIEAARAGDAGRGFAVVAEEIRKLADQTKESTKEISSLMEHLNEGTHYATETIDQAVKEADLQASKVKDVERDFLAISEQIKRLALSIEEIEGTAKELITSNNTIVDAITQLSSVSEEVAAGSEQVRNISQENSARVSEAVQTVKEVVETAQELKKYRR